MPLYRQTSICQGMEWVEVDIENLSLYEKKTIFRKDFSHNFIHSILSILKNL